MTIGRTWRQFVVLLQHEMRLEFRTKESLWTAGLFAAVLLTVFVFSGFDDRRIALRAFPGVLWVSVSFVGSVIFARSFQRERTAGLLDALLLVPGALDGLFVARILTNLLLLLLIEALMVPIAVGVFDVSLSGAAVGWLSLTLLCCTFGYAVMGTVLAAAFSTVRLREVLLPIVLFPLTIPLLVAGVRATVLLVTQPHATAALDWLGIVVTFDLLFLVVGRWLFVQTMDSAVVQN